MKKLESAGYIAKVFANLQGFFSSNSYHERVEDGLIGTADSLVYWVDEPTKKDGSLYSDRYVQKQVSHFLRRYKANRKKLK